MRAGIVRKHTDNIDLVEVLEFSAAEFDELATEDEMEQLFRRLFGRHGVPGQYPDGDLDNLVVEPTRIRFRGRASARLSRRDGHGRQPPARHARLAAHCTLAADR